MNPPLACTQPQPHPNQGDPVASDGSGSTPDVATVPLAKLRVGQRGTIQEKRLAEPDKAVLRAMGLSCNASVTLCRQGEPCIVAITTGGAAGGRLGEAGGARDGGCRIGLTRELSEKIFVSLHQAH